MDLITKAGAVQVIPEIRWLKESGSKECRRVRARPGSLFANGAGRCAVMPGK